ncbi:hypothetical protein DdX_15511 [Ditylenchus destructor]|uniref:Uncharacterized protein n=1 Tax=Ditylenchus destructor TaxID=166010 RepID=A0AAD4MQP0_9BILA|nr:hypothetical protein DdX_15511 [Ditylenchus destructor]
MYVQRYSASAVREAGGNESVSLCMSYNGSEAEVEDNWKRLICYGHSINIPITAHSNFTVFAKFHDGEWHSLLWFDYLKWSKSYIPGNCSYEEQVLDGIVHPFAICMRRNVTEKFYKNITQVDETSSTLRITECNDYAETSESIKETSQSINPSSVTPTLLDQDDTGFSRMDEVRNVEDETLQRFFNPFATTSSAPREITKMLIFSCFWFTNAVKRILAFEEHNLCDFLPLISAMLLNYYYNYYNCNNYF